MYHHAIEMKKSETITKSMSSKGLDKPGLILIMSIVIGHAIKHIYNSGFESIIFPEIKTSLRLNNTLLGTLATSRQFGAGGSTFVAGYLGDRFSRHTGILLSLSLAIMGISYLFVGLSTLYWIMLLAMFISGIGPSLYHPPALGALSRRFPENKGLAISLHGTGGSIGQAIGPLAAGFFIIFAASNGASNDAGWRMTMQWSVIPALVAAISIWIALRGVPKGEEIISSFRDYVGPIGKLLRQRSLVGILTIASLRNLGVSATVIFLPIYLREDLEYSIAKVAIYLSLSQVAGIVAQPLMGILSDKFGRKAVLVPALLVFGILLFLLSFAKSEFWLITVIISLGAFLYSLHALFLATTADLAGKNLQATSASLTYGVTFISSTISPLIAGLIADQYSVSSVFIYSSFISILAAISLYSLSIPNLSDNNPKPNQNNIGKGQA